MSITIPPFGSHQLKILFKPTAAGVRNGQLSFTSNAPSSPHNVPLLGYGVGEEVPPPDPEPELGDLTYLTAVGGKLKDQKGAGEVVRLRSINWYGFEQTGVPGGAWTRPFRTKVVNGVLREGMLDEIKRLGFNSIRLLFSQDCTWPGYKPETRSGYWNSTYINPQMNPEFLNATAGEDPQNVKTTMEIMDIFVGWCEALGLRIVLDMHTLAPDDSNVLATNGKWYTTNHPDDVGATAGQKREPRSEAQAIAAHVFLANRYKNRPVVCGFDMINEPHVCTWDRDPLTGVLGYFERAGKAVHAVNPDVLIICEGVTGNVDHTPVGHEGDTESQMGLYNWGTWWSGKLDSAGSALVTLNIPNKVVYSPHEYGTYLDGVVMQPWFDPEGRVGAGYAGLPYPQNMAEVWRRQWGYLAEEGIAPVWIGEFGSYFRVGGDPITGQGAGYDAENLALDEEWMDTLADYCDEHDISFAYWAWNPGGDPDGLVGQQPAGQWHEAQAFKLEYLEPFITPIPVAEISLSLNTVPFGTVASGTENYRTIEVQNSTDEAITVTSSVVGAGYTVSPDIGNVPANGVMTLTVVFSPTAEGSFPATLNVAFGVGGLVTATLTGVASDDVPVEPEVDPIVIDLPPTAYGITAVGDSLTEGGVYLNNGWLVKACFYGNHGLRYRGTKAVSGSTVQEALELQLPQILAMSPRPKACVVASGTNSIYSGTGGVNQIKEICDILVANKIYPILWTIPPRNDTSGQDANVASWNDMIRQYHRDTGIPLVDAFEALRVSGSYRAEPAYMNPDGLHFSNYGYTVLGRYAVDSGAFGDIPTDGTLPLPTAVGGSNLVPNPLFAGSGGVSNNFTLGTGFTGQLLPAEAGNWQRIIRPIGVTGNTSVVSRIAVFAVTPGQKHSLACKVRWNTGGMLGGVGVENAAWQLGMMAMFTDTSWNNYTDGLNVVMGPQGDSVEEGTLFIEITAPSGANRLALQLFTMSDDIEANDVEITLDFSQLTVITGSFPFNNIDPTPVPNPGPGPNVLLDSSENPLLDSSSNELES
jgi:aryl-phospho-beta-D-glucosidase BglC (GH1 family)/lysophospholipase L1-like esterase